MRPLRCLYLNAMGMQGGFQNSGRGGGAIQPAAGASVPAEICWQDNIHHIRWRWRLTLVQAAAHRAKEHAACGGGACVMQHAQMHPRTWLVIFVTISASYGRLSSCLCQPMSE